MKLRNVLKAIDKDTQVEVWTCYIDDDGDNSRLSVVLNQPVKDIPYQIMYDYGDKKVVGIEIDKNYQNLSILVKGKPKVFDEPVIIDEDTGISPSGKGIRIRKGNRPE